VLLILSIREERAEVNQLAGELKFRGIAWNVDAEEFAGWNLPILHYAGCSDVDLGDKEYLQVEPLSV